MLSTNNISINDSPLEKSFWSFSQNLFAQDSVKEIFSYLEKKYELNANLLLFCCWYASHQNQILDIHVFKSLLTRIEYWHIKLVEELKTLLEIIKNQNNQQVFLSCIPLIHENLLLTQKIEQYLLLQQMEESLSIQKANIEKIDSSVQNAVTNVFNYIKYLNIKVHQNDLEKIYVLIKASNH
jgi:uncharacterized protein (TIGR02444 family)